MAMISAFQAEGESSILSTRTKFIVGGKLAGNFLHSGASKQLFDTRVRAASYD